MTRNQSSYRSHPMSGKLVLLLLLAASSGCYRLKPSSGGGQTTFDGARQVNPADVALPNGYEIEPVAVGLHFPTDVTFDADGTPYVTEAGYSYGGAPGAAPRLVRITGRQTRQTIAEGTNGPWNGVAFQGGAFFVAGGHAEGGQVLRITPGRADGGSNARVDTLAGGWPSYGDHHTNGPAMGPKGWLYVGQGTATNSGVVGIDNYHQFGWLREHPDFHDRPCRDVRVRGASTAPPTRSPLPRATRRRPVPSCRSAKQPKTACAP